MKDEKKLIRNSTAEFLIFTGQSGGQSIEARYEDETIWLTQKLMATLFDVSVPTINEHLKNILSSGELVQDSVIRKFRITAADGKQYNTNFYNLDVIISVGYRVNSVRATQFRQWATQVLREFAIKGYVLDKKRMENGSFLGEDYFERLKGLTGSVSNFSMDLDELSLPYKFDVKSITGIHNPTLADHVARVGVDIYP
ncbi:MAG: virulence RhuM family protein [Proteobacteria bacterium]|nr:virulence RhuM family protein [Desulfocapsa sp.]MBU3943862.1 virulence RhuM family protein [Pseudomonadota bacterium]MCG2745768.1 virulence RhuM family protein [Desulfobacteraceae bacterium]MBU4027989.1 virulence RhuM family protein [Pseudomonadota bacterium]MBU4041460.1 virulence RhuM family protein [Pseudomonadota bacterium]